MAIKSIRRLRFLCLAAAAVMQLTACGGGSSSTSTLSGVAAVGAPIISGAVKVSCSGGSALNTTTSSSGSWTVTTSGQTLPCAVQVSGGTAGGVANTTPYHSIALSFGTVNITPLTDLVVAQMLSASPQTWFASPVFASVNATNLNAALAAVSTNLGLSTTLGSVSPFTTVFVPQNGVMLDNVLEAIKTTLTNLGQNYAALLAAAQANSYATNFSTFGSVFGTVYVAPVVSGGSGVTSGATSCSTGQTLLSFAPAASVTSKYTSGQGVCFTASSTSLAFLSKTLTGTPSTSTATQTVTIFTDTADSYTYEVVIDSGSITEINVVNGSYAGQFTPPATGGTLLVDFFLNSSKVHTFSITGVTKPTTNTDFCADAQANGSLAYLTALGTVGTLNCTYNNGIGNITTTVLGFAYSIDYTYQ